MTLTLIVLLLLSLAAGGAAWRAWRPHRRITAFAVWTSPMLALLLAAVFYPPGLRVRDEQLTVLTAGTTPAQLRSLPWLRRTIALPEADAATGDIERAPDLATALRRHPATRHLKIVGAGLGARDQDAARGLSLSFEAMPESSLISLQAPTQVAQGTRWSLDGRALKPAARVELLDPAGATVDAATLSADGAFRLSAAAGVAGTLQYQLRLTDAKQAVIDTAAIPLAVTPGEALSVILRAGTPDPEFKYWRRWAADAGIHVQASAGLSEGLSLRDGDTRLTPAALAVADLVMIDERAWLTLDAGEKAALRQAVSEGLGLLLRISGPLTPDVATDWAALGVQSHNSDETARSLSIDQYTGLHARDAYTIAPVMIEPGGDERLLKADDGLPLAFWHAQGRGRIGVWRLLDSYRLGLLGEPAAYAGLWQSALAAMTRPRPAEWQPRLPDWSWVDERAVICGLRGKAANVRDPAGVATPLLIDGQGCAAIWPSTAGWHRLLSNGRSLPFFVHAADEARGLRLARDRAATLALVRKADDAGPAVSREAVLPRLPFFLAWLLLAGLVWWRERPR